MPVGAGGSPVLGRGRAHPLPAGERRAPRLRPPVPRNGPGEEAREKLQSSSPRRGPFPSPAPLPRRAGKRPPAPAGPPRWAGLGWAALGGQRSLPPSLPPHRGAPAAAGTPGLPASHPRRLPDPAGRGLTCLFYDYFFVREEPGGLTQPYKAESLITES